MYEQVLAWPGGAKIAVAISVVWESWDRDLGTPESHVETNRRPLPRNARYRRDIYTVFDHAFAETGGLQSLLSVWADYGVRTTHSVGGSTIASYPQLVENVLHAGHELAVQTWTYEPLVLTDGAEFEAEMRRVIDTYTHAVGTRPSGFSPTGGYLAPWLLDSLMSLEFAWVDGYRNTDIPFVARTGPPPLVAFGEPLMSDFDTYSPRSLAPRELYTLMRDEFDELYAEGVAGRPKLLCLNVHPFLARPFRLAPLRGLLEHITGTPDVLVTTKADLARWLAAEYPQCTLASAFPTSGAKSNAHYALRLDDE